MDSAPRYAPQLELTRPHSLSLSLSLSLKTDTTTSALLPSSTPPDLLSSLHLADLIRSSALPPQQASKSLLRRLRNDNPNVQLLTLSCLDIAIKNGGTPFLQVIANDDMPKDLESLGRGGATVNREVKDRVLAKLQDWATAFEQKESLRSSSLVMAYQRMRSEGLPFPPKDPTATAAMVDSLSVSSGFGASSLIPHPSFTDSFLHTHTGPRMDRRLVLHPLSHRFQHLQSQASLSQLWLRV
jgi:hypothetical protein